MDINCTNGCLYQMEGKCTLNKLNSLFDEYGESGLDCAYFCARKK